MHVDDDAKRLAAILADWATPASALTIYFFGSRVRGDHRPDSDVDIYLKWNFAALADSDTHWWSTVNQDLFATINAKLPGPLGILDENDTDLIPQAILSAPQVYRDRNVICVWRAPKLSSDHINAPC